MMIAASVYFAVLLPISLATRKYRSFQFISSQHSTYYRYLGEEEIQVGCVLWHKKCGKPGDLTWDVSGNVDEAGCLGLCRSHKRCAFIQFYPNKNHCYLKEHPQSFVTDPEAQAAVRFRQCINCTDSQ